MLIIFSGLPGTGKTTLSRMLAARIGAVYLRVDTIEAGLKRSMLQIGSAEDAGYQAGCAIAEENLRLGMLVVADSVNPIAISRRLWESAARKADCPFKSIEIICSDTDEHRRRVESRTTD
ncbi:MAG: AAA family ATPase, partial [Sneathiella sp.]